MFAFRDVVSTFIQTHTHKTTECTLHTMGNATISFRPFSFSPARKDTASNRLNQTMVLDYGRRRCGAIMVWCCMRFNRNFAALTQRILNWIFFRYFHFFFAFFAPTRQICTYIVCATTIAWLHKTLFTPDTLATCSPGKHANVQMRWQKVRKHEIVYTTSEAVYSNATESLFGFVRNVQFAVQLI